MHLSVIMRILGILLMVFSLTMLLPGFISLGLNENASVEFFTAFTITLSTGFLLWLPFKRSKKDLRTRDGFLITALFWTVLGLFGALPFFLTSHIDLSLAEAVFESISGLTTTGATVIVGLDELPKALLFYRQLLQWLGGMGIIVLAVAILPMLGIGGMQLYRTEAPGPIKDTKLTPRITETAKALWYIYASITILCCLAFWAAGMSFFDAICHSFSTVAIGGFSTHDTSFQFFDSALIESIAIFFMMASGINFALHFFAWQKRSLFHYTKDPEFLFYLGILLALSAITIVGLANTQTYPFVDSIRNGIFQAVSIATTTGFVTADYSQWPGAIPFLLFIAAFAGGCAGSTGGGMKVIRILLLSKQGWREIKRLIHPSGIFSIRVGHQAVPPRIIEAVWGFFAVYILAFVVMLVVLLMLGLDQVTAWSAVGATLNNLGPGLGQVAANYSVLADSAKWVLCFSMLLGRLEVFTLIVIFSPLFWRK